MKIMQFLYCSFGRVSSDAILMIFGSGGPPGESPEQDAAAKCASESRFFIGTLHDLR